MKTKCIQYLIIILLLSNCSKKEVKLPLIDIEGIHQIQNHSSIWIFFNLKDQDTLAILNKKNKLLNTHWIFNIDKRLTMKEVVPYLVQMQHEKNKKSMHKKDVMLNYLSYADMASNQISLLEFDIIHFVDNEHDYIELLKKKEHAKVLELEIKKESFELNHLKVNSNELTNKLNELVLTDTLSDHIIFLKYHKNTSYQNYLKAKVILSKTNFKVCQSEFIFKTN